MLVGAHASRDAIHDDANLVCGHSKVTKSGVCEADGKNEPSATT
jgi:hypothetical protein